jgi:hypothetical protein
MRRSVHFYKLKVFEERIGRCARGGTNNRTRGRVPRAHKRIVAPAGARTRFRKVRVVHWISFVAGGILSKRSRSRWASTGVKRSMSWAARATQAARSSGGHGVAVAASNIARILWQVPQLLWVTIFPRAPSAAGPPSTYIPPEPSPTPIPCAPTLFSCGCSMFLSN